MARRRRSADVPVAAAVDEVEVRLRAAQMAFAAHGAMRGIPNWMEDPFWDGWEARSRKLYGSRDREAIAAHYEAAIERLGAGERYERELIRYRRHLELNARRKAR